uniref:PDZ domain-containing protein n=1 Tax=Cajanus cajan TaxID=3821 RepID=A0A151REG7_CAJCA|nr:hypothetical protein KK1_037839 [Cajanus cajan]
MQVISSACNLWSLGVPTHTTTTTTTTTTSLLSRREICFDGMSSVCSHSPNHVLPPISISRCSSTIQDETLDFGAMLRKAVLSPTRRALMASLTMYPCFCSSRYLSALALGDPSVTLEEVTPPVFSPGPLFPIEDRIVQLFERNTYSVVNIFDVTLRPQLNVTGVVEIPEGNGSGVVWDEDGHIVTNYHVIGNALSRNPNAGEIVARVNILASEGLQKNFEGRLVGADRLKDLAVLKAWVVRAGLNVEIAPDLIANQLNVRNGALVLLVPANSVAAKAGLNPTTRGFAGNIVLGDIIVAVDNKPVKSKAELLKALDEYNVGDKVVLMVQRGSEKLELPVVLEEQSS